MNAFVRKIFVLASVVAFGASTQARAGTSTTSYGTMAPLVEYMSLNANAEIALARSAAPATISHDATILVLEKTGYRKAVRGTNGFTCLVERSWMSPFDSGDFWNPRIRGPICYNPPAVRSILPYTIDRTKLVVRGLTKTQMHATIVAALVNRKSATPESGAMSYMMSRAQYLGDNVGHWIPHLMFHTPKMAAATWGADLAGSPVMYDDGHHDTPEPETIFMVPVSHWSDGAPVRKAM